MTDTKAKIQHSFFMAMILFLAKILLYGQGYYIPGGDIEQTGGLAVKIRRVIAFVFLLCLAFTSGQASLDSSGSTSPDYNAKTDPYCGYYPQIDISPILPTQNDTIQITPSGEWPDSCIPLYQSHQIVDNVVIIDAVIDYPGIVCSTVIQSWGFTVDVGALPSGSYRVDVYITDLMYDFPTSTLCITKSFTVLTEFNKIYLPVIPIQSATLFDNSP